MRKVLFLILPLVLALSSCRGIMGDPPSILEAAEKASGSTGAPSTGIESEVVAADDNLPRGIYQGAFGSDTDSGFFTLRANVGGGSEGIWLDFSVNGVEESLEGQQQVVDLPADAGAGNSRAGSSGICYAFGNGNYSFNVTLGSNGSVSPSKTVCTRGSTPLKTSVEKVTSQTAPAKFFYGTYSGCSPSGTVLLTQKKMSNSWTSVSMGMFYGKVGQAAINARMNGTAIVFEGANPIGLKIGGSISSNTASGTWSYEPAGSGTWIATPLGSSGTVETPIFSPSGGGISGTQLVSISSTAGATIRYTTNGSAPTRSSPRYGGPISVSPNTVVKAKAYKAGMKESGLGQATFYLMASQTVATPTFSLAAGSYPNPISVELRCSTSGASIRYTTNGNTPDSQATLYTGPISISASTTIKAKAFGSGGSSSAVASATYTIDAPAPSVESIRLGSLSNGGSTTTRTQTLTAVVPNPGSSSTTTYDGEVRVYVNGVYETVLPTYSSGAWRISRPISLNAGENAIKIAVYHDGERYCSSSTWTIYGDFAQVAYRFEISWDTNQSDIDIHLVKDGNWGYSGHCYYDNKKIAGMATLDYDDTNGYGPENLSIESGAPSGSYAIYVKYYSTHGQQSPVHVSVKVYENGSYLGTETHTFSPSDASTNSSSYNPAIDWLLGEYQL